MVSFEGTIRVQEGNSPCTVAMSPTIVSRSLQDASAGLLRRFISASCCVAPLHGSANRNNKKYLDFARHLHKTVITKHDTPISSSLFVYFSTDYSTTHDSDRWRATDTNNHHDLLEYYKWPQCFSRAVFLNSPVMPYVPEWSRLPEMFLVRVARGN